MSAAAGADSSRMRTTSFQAPWAIACITATLSAAAPKAQPDYTAHEWGTFTSIQGSDGIPIPWNPLATSDLPDFVHSRQNPATGPAIAPHRQFLSQLDGKGSTTWLQRMETPVIYFHTKESLQVSVRVDMPSGRLTEWFPAAFAYGPLPAISGFLPGSTNSYLEWPGLAILPSAHPGDVVGRLPHLDAPSHYYAARQVTASPVRTTIGAACTRDGVGENEQFVFYRGVGNFTAPLHVRSENGSLLMENTGATPIASAFVWQAQGSVASFAQLGPLAPGATSRTEIPEAPAGEPRPALAKRLQQQMTAALIAAGLHRDEAAAMIATWRDSWFDEDGTRVLYLVPRPFVDATLPITFDPAPNRFERVFVGRAEVIDAAREQRGDALFAEFRKAHDPAILDGFHGLVAPRFTDALITAIGNRQITAQPAAERSPGNEPGAQHPEILRILEDLQKVRAELTPRVQRTASTSSRPSTPDTVAATAR